jgi:hypothetical protein
MVYLLLILTSVVLFWAFLSVTIVEARTGTRLFASQRTKFDKQIGKALFIAKHVDWLEFFTHAVESFFERVLHDSAHLSLTVVRVIERELSETVRYLRDRRPNMLAPKASRSSLRVQATRYIRRTFRHFVSREEK